MSGPHAPPVSVRLTTLPSHDCNYLPGRVATTRAFRTDNLPADLYHEFMDAGFRRSGNVIYQPICAACQKCLPLRVPVDRFAADKSQRRCARRNADLIISQGRPELTDEKLDLYQRYLLDWHGKDVENHLDRESLQSFLYESPVDTLEFCYRTPDQKLVAVGIADVCVQSFSSVYFYFDPQESDRGLGTFGALHEIEHAKTVGILYYYLGFWVHGCAAMQYKSRFRPCQILDNDGVWKDL
jgi:arginyl-tRNA--protein-N-Asp/Glu arginylyltransferase